MLKTIVLSALVSSLTTFVGNLLLIDYQARRVRRQERRQKLWTDKKELIQKLEKSAGFVVEQVTGGTNHTAKKNEVKSTLLDVEILKHSLRRFPRLRDAINEFVHSAGWVIDNNSIPTQKNQLIEEVEGKYDDLIEAIDSELLEDRF
jgi:hypothetical protein